SCSRFIFSVVWREADFILKCPNCNKNMKIIQLQLLTSITLCEGNQILY
ncbi:hypothetical protein cypCar_00035451, partial [Cyprinus carpio]